jgi:site-specific recombinase XerD
MIRDQQQEQQDPLARLKEWMELRGLAPNSVATYSRCARQFLEWAAVPVSQVNIDAVEAYILELAERGRSARTRNVNVAAIHSLFLATRGQGLGKSIPRAKVTHTVPEILSGSEVELLLAATRSPKYRAIFMVEYGAGLRISEALTLEVSDIDSRRMLIRVREGKTGQRYVMMSPRVLEALRIYWKAYRPPGPELFPGYEPDDPQTIKPGTHQSRESVSRVLIEATRAAGITKHVSPHTLRHTFATHLLESGVDVRTVQLLLGHRRLESTAKYLHLTTAQLLRVPSPLDLIGTPRGRRLG